MKSILLLLALSSPAFCLSSPQSQDIGGSSVTWSGTETAQNNLVLSTGSRDGIGTIGTNPYQIAEGVVWAQSLDSITETTGCVVALNLSAQSTTAKWVATSTTTVPVMEGVVPGVLIGTTTCAPLAWCQYGTRGYYYVLADGTIQGAGSLIEFGSTKCTTQPTGSVNTATIGTNAGPPGGFGANTHYWLKLGF